MEGPEIDWRLGMAWPALAGLSWHVIYPTCQGRSGHMLYRQAALGQPSTVL